MAKPVCVKCKLFFSPKQNGIEWTEGMPTTGLAMGEERGGWVPYKVWQSDLWKCKGCGAEIVIGHGHKPLAVKHQDDFAERGRFSEFQVDDC